MQGKSFVQGKILHVMTWFKIKQRFIWLHSHSICKHRFNKPASRISVVHKSNVRPSWCTLQVILWSMFSQTNRIIKISPEIGPRLFLRKCLHTMRSHRISRWMMKAILLMLVHEPWTMLCQVVLCCIVCLPGLKRLSGLDPHRMTGLGNIHFLKRRISSWRIRIDLIG